MRHLTSLDVSIELQSAGVLQQSEYSWYIESTTGRSFTTNKDPEGYYPIKICSAYTIPELKAMLSEEERDFHCDNAADVGKAIWYLISSGAIEVNDINTRIQNKI